MPRWKEWHLCVVRGKARDPLGQQDTALTASSDSQEAGDKAPLYRRSKGAKALPPAPRNAAGVLIRSLPGSWPPPRGPGALWPRFPATPAAGGAGVRVPASEAGTPQPALGGRPGLHTPRGYRARGDPSKRVPAAPQPLPGPRTRPGRPPAPPSRAPPGPASAPRAPPLLNHLEEKNYYRIRCTSARWVSPFPSA